MRDNKGRFVKGEHYSSRTEFKKEQVPWIKGRRHTEESINIIVNKNC